MIRQIPLIPLLLLAGLALAGCRPARGDSTAAATPAQTPSEAALRSLPLGAPPGEPVSPAASVKNPYEGDDVAVQQGKTLFGAMNCVYCHGAQGAGLMGPSLRAGSWRYGGAPAEIYNSIHDGRPQGMPAWGARLPPDQIWKLVAYVESLGAAAPPASAKMAAMGAAQSSTTGDQVAGQSKTDSSHEALVADDRRRGG